MLEIDQVQHFIYCHVHVYMYTSATVMRCVDKIVATKKISDTISTIQNYAGDTDFPLTPPSLEQ